VLGAFAGAASAQSSVTLSGTVDANVQYVKNGDVKTKTLGTSGLNSSQLVFSGREDLGSGLYAGFQLNSGIGNDNGTAGSNPGTTNSKFWNRRSTVSLGGSFGEVRLGRDYTPTFNAYSDFDPFGTNGLGDMEHAFNFANGLDAGTAAATEARADNAVQYFLPDNIGGVYGNVMVAAAENTANNRYEGGRIGYKAGPINANIGYGQTHLFDKDHKLKELSTAVSYDFGVVKIDGIYLRQKADQNAIGTDVDNLMNVWQLGAVVPIGVGEIHASYTQSKGKDDLEDQGAKMAAIGYVYNLSKRTALYGTYSYLKNDSLGAFSVGGAVDPTQPLGFKSQGAQVGLRHFF